MKHLDYITNADVILLWFPSQNRTFLGRKPYVFGSETDCLKQILYLSTKLTTHTCMNVYLCIEKEDTKKGSHARNATAS